VSFQHFNQAIAHIIAQGIRLTPSARILLLVIYGKAEPTKAEPNGVFYSSYPTLTKLAGISDPKSTKTAIKELEALTPKVLSHYQRRPGGVNYYRLENLCPSDCKARSHKTTQGAKTPLPSVSNPLPQEVDNPLHIELNKPIKKTSGTLVCNFCQGEQYAEGVVHETNCRTYRRWINSPSWEVTKNQNSATWLQMTEHDKQIAHLVSLAEMTKREADKATTKQTLDEEFTHTFSQSLIAKSSSGDIKPDWVTWLMSIHSPETFNGKIGEFAYLRALHYSRQGLPVPNQAELSNRPRINPYPEIVAPGCEQAPDQLSA
jgi:hypothetical protein